MLKKIERIFLKVINEHKIYAVVILISLLLYLFSKNIAIVIDAMKILVKEEFK